MTHLCYECEKELDLCGDCHNCADHCTCGRLTGLFDPDELGLDPETDNKPTDGSRDA